VTVSTETMPLAIAMQRTTWRNSFKPLGMHNYRLYVVAAFLTNTAGWAMRVAVDWLVLELTGNLALVGLTIAIQFAPLVLLGVWGGVIADRFPKRRLIVLCQSVSALICATLAVLALTGAVQLWMVYLLVALLGLAGIVDPPSRSVLVSEIVGPTQLRNAISLNASNFHLGALIGPAISGVVIGLAGSGWAIAAQAVACAVGALLLVLMRTREMTPTPRAKRAKGQIREAIRYVRDKPALLWTFIVVAFVATFGMPLPTMLAAMAATEWHTGAQGYGLYTSLVAVGAFSGALLSTRRGSLRLRAIVFGAMAYGLVQAGLGVAPVLAVFLVLLVFTGLTRLLYATAAETMAQLSANLMIRGRVMAFFFLVLVGGQALGGPLMGWLAETLGARTSLVISGAVPALAAGVIAVLLARTGQLTVRVAPSLRGSWVTIVPRAVGADLE
jgi:MFS family permease